MFSPLSNRAVYLGEGIWWQLTERQIANGVGRGLPQRIRPLTIFSKDRPHAK